MSLAGTMSGLQLENQKEKALELKGKGNKALMQGLYDAAVDFYTQSLDADSSNAVVYANRAQAHIKTEAYGLAIADASASIEQDPSYTKAFYRRAVAYSAILRYKEALADFKVVVDKAPADKDAKLKYAECQKIVRRIAFEKAIKVDDEPLLFDTLDVKSVPEDEKYDGPKLDIQYGENNQVDVSMSLEWINQVVERFKNGKLIPKKYLYAIVLNAMRLFKEEPTMVKVPVPDKKMITVCGDTHGQFFDLLEIFRLNGGPSPDHMYLFNGDFVDRGSWSCEIAILFYCYKIVYPGQFFVNRGNHETVNMNKVYGFEGECKHKFGSDNVFKLFTESFTFLPLATLIGEKYLVLHGGLFSNDDVTLDDIQKVDRFQQAQPGNTGLMMEMLWTDPQEEEGRSASKRGVGIQFGPDVTDNFCQKNNLNAIIRSHEVRQGGYSEEHGGRLITVFSAPNYCDSQGNLGAYINIGPELKLDFKTFKEVPHPNVKPMAYASNLMGY